MWTVWRVGQLFYIVLPSPGVWSSLCLGLHRYRPGISRAVELLRLKDWVYSLGSSSSVCYFLALLVWASLCLLENNSNTNLTGFLWGTQHCCITPNIFLVLFTINVILLIIYHDIFGNNSMWIRTCIMCYIEFSFL